MAIVQSASKCPYCREEIVTGALLCKHCGMPLVKRQRKKPPFWRSPYMLGAYSGVAFMILMIYLYSRIF
ncbi:MAG: hypothetical protein JSV44_09040 [Candidatus Zixiibacteriota bacterium]|nr:MAG: hypothetical protein JSV44_09040 [candidate division Zixibacteria bacterium]